MSQPTPCFLFGGSDHLGGLVGNGHLGGLVGSDLLGVLVGNVLVVSDLLGMLVGILGALDLSLSILCNLP